MGRTKGKSIPATCNWQGKNHPWKDSKTFKPYPTKKKKHYVRNPETLSRTDHHPDKLRYPDWTIRIPTRWHNWFFRNIQCIGVNDLNNKDIEAFRDTLIAESDRRNKLINSITS